MIEQKQGVDWIAGWKYYTPRWLIFGAVSGAATPVYNTVSDQFWAVKSLQIENGVLFGAACAIAFLPVQNYFNASRKVWLSWTLIVVVNLVLKFSIAAALA